MRFHELDLPGAYLIDLEPVRDERGFNARAWCADEFAAAGLATTVAQVNVIHNHRAGTVRGMHYQVPPHTEAKLFRVTRGGIHDAVVDLRADSPTYLQWRMVELRAEDHRMLYVPEGFGQGFQTLVDDTELTYQVTAAYHPDAGAGFRHNDPFFAIDWSLPVTTISERDASWPDFHPDEHHHDFARSST